MASEGITNTIIGATFPLELLHIRGSVNLQNCTVSTGVREAKPRPPFPFVRINIPFGIGVKLDWDGDGPTGCNIYLTPKGARDLAVRLMAATEVPQ